MNTGAPVTQTVNIALLENGLDSAHYALERLSGNPSKRDLKHAILFLSSSVELVLKERLQRHDWRLLFSKQASATEAAYKAGEFKSIDLDESLKRLATHCGIEISDAAKNALRNFKRKRNKVEHFSIIDTADAITAAAAETLGILLDFIAHYLDPIWLDSGDAELLEDIRAKTGEFQRFVNHRMAEISGALEEAYGLSTCPSCLQDALVLGEESPRCRFCGYSGDGEDAARRFVRNVLRVDEHRIVSKGGDAIRRVCPDCGAVSLVVDDRNSGNMDPNPQEAICMSCGNSWGEGRLINCMDCGELFAPHGGGDFRCSDCFSSYCGADNT